LRKAWYKNQKEHWLGWLEKYGGPAKHGRRKRVVTAEAVYNRIADPTMILWLGEAAGIPDGQVNKAIAAAKHAGVPWQAQCGAIRRVIPWTDIASRLASREVC
jgi:hypothetical protein